MDQEPKIQRNSLTSQDSEYPSVRLLVRVNGTNVTSPMYQDNKSALLMNMSADDVPPGLVDRMIEAVRAEIARTGDD